MLGVLSCSSKPALVGRSEGLPELPANARISMSRTVCFGSCPVYDLEIRADGRALFTGVAHVRVRDGHQTKQLRKEVVAGLFAEFQKAGYFSWKDGYESPATDLPTVITSVTLGPLRKEITDYGPDDEQLYGTDRVVREELAALEHRVDAMEGQTLHPVREARGWVFDPAEVAALKATRTAQGPSAAPMPEGRLAARVFFLFDHGRELREIVQELEVAPSIVRDLWHDWLIGLEDGEMERRKTAEQERRRRAQEKELQALERRSDQEQRNFETTMATIAASLAGGKDK